MLKYFNADLQTLLPPNSYLMSTDIRDFRHSLCNNNHKDTIL